MADDIARSMKRRETDLLEGQLLNAAVLLDVHHNSQDVLGEEARKTGEKAVIDLYLRLQGFDTDDDAPAAVTTTSQDSESDEDIRALRKKSSTSSVDAGEMEVSRAESPSQNSRVTTANPRGAAIASVMAGLKALAERKSTLRKIKKDMVALIK